MESLIDIEAATRRMASMIDNLLLMGKADAGKLELKPRAIDLLALCRVLIAETISSNHVGREISLEYEGIDSPAMSDEQILRLILSNLLTNALKYSPRERVPRLRVARVGRHVFITVYDQGIGIPEEDRPALFQAFRRARNVGLTSGRAPPWSLLCRFFQGRQREGICPAQLSPHRHEKNTRDR